MNEFKKVSLQDFVTLQRGFDLPSHQRTPGNVPVVASTGISSWHNEAKVKAPGVVIGRSGSIGGGQFLEQDFWPLNTTLYVKDFKGNNPRFAYYVLKLIDFSAFNAGAGVPTLNRNHIASIEVISFERGIQDRIASVLAHYDSAIANCRRQIALLEEAAMRLYKEWFKDGKGERKTLGDLIVEIESGSRPRGGAVKSGIPSIGAEKIDGIGNYDYTGEKFVSREYFDRMKRGKIQDEDILLYKDGAYCGKVSMVLDGFPHKEAATNEHVFILRTDRHSAFLYCFLRQRKSFELLNKLACNKAAQPGLNQQDVLGVKIVIPQQDDMESFENMVMPVMHTIAFHANQIRALTEARDRLLPKLMKGEIAV